MTGLLLLLLLTLAAAQNPNCDRWFTVPENLNGASLEEMAHEAAYCQAGIVNTEEQLLAPQEAPGPRARVRARGTAARASALNMTGSILYYDPRATCSDPGDWGSFPKRLQSSAAGFFTVRDQGICGDSYLVYDNGVLLGATSDPGCTTPASCQASCQYSRGCFYLEPDVEHNIEVFMQQSLYNGFVGVFIAYFAEAPGADCSMSDLTGSVFDIFGNPLSMWNQSCVLEPAYQGNVPCSPGGPYPTPVLCPAFQTE